MPHSSVVVGRQAIVDRDGATLGYELLFRQPAAALVPVAGVPVGPLTGDQMTATVMVGALSLGLDRLANGRLLFCNADRGVLVGDTPVSLPPATTVIEVLESVEIDDEVVEGCRRLISDGFVLALDDMVWREGIERLLPLVDIVKIDLLNTDREAAAELAARCRPYGVQLLAEKVETDDDVAWACAQGFSLFQGYAIERPRLIEGRTLAPTATTRLRLAAMVLAEDLEVVELERLVASEPGLMVQLLHLAAAGADHGVRRTVRTIREALVLVGSTRIRQWISLLLLTDRSSISRPSLVTVLSRAKMCELLAQQRGVTDGPRAYVVGMLSGLDLLLGRPMSEIEDVLEVDPALMAAVRGEGPLGELVSEVIAYQGDVAGSGDGAVGSGGDLSQLHTVAAEAFAWASDLDSLLPEKVN
ncbi:EAL domain-containing protein [Nocardioides mangrovicus]|uniref:EAL domain-containing protein n=1 Tax=Nocardioides mangrovicus TaxID=2478913 RepID=A0A3L8P1S7_9ACTN|nr:HDOD domain-containing protein [Nocardioides mangrovicus]RLV49380.1 EAL domain-containing protein [Nocardioides mangrovicus]